LKSEPSSREYIKENEGIIKDNKIKLGTLVQIISNPI
jgi:hypothetical protein